MKRKHMAIILGIFIVTLFVSLASFTQEDFKITELKNPDPSYPTTSIWYRGVVAADIGDGDANHEMVCDFGDMGIWVYGTSTKWQQIAPENPDWIIGIQLTSGSYEIVADFGTDGLWIWDYPNTWIRISPDDAENGYAVDDDGDGIDELHADFGEIGIWRYDIALQGWTLLTGWNPDVTQQSDSWTTGIGEICYDFGAGGLWINWWPPEYPTWRKLSPNNIGADNAAGDMGAGDIADEIAFDFEDIGFWIYQYDSTPNWHQITGDFVVDLIKAHVVTGTDYDLIVQFNTIAGLWMWDYNGAWPGQWTRLSPDDPTWDEAFCEPFDPDGVMELTGEEEFAADFNTLGLWLYDHYAPIKWIKINEWSPQFMVRADLNGVGVDTCLVCDFGTEGLWYYDGQTGTWTKLSPDSPDRGFTF